MYALKFRSNALVAIGLDLFIRLDISLWFCSYVSDSTLGRECFLS